jgi:hypothetical protein
LAAYKNTPAYQVPGWNGLAYSVDSRTVNFQAIKTAKPVKITAVGGNKKL